MRERYVLYGAGWEAERFYIHQDVRAENPFSYFLSDEYVLPRLKKDCISVTVPNLVGFGRFLFPTMHGGFKKIDIAGSPWEFFFADTFIDSLYQLGKCIGLEGKTENIKEDLGAKECFVWPFVKNALGLHWSQHHVRRNNASLHWTKLVGESLDIREYVREYIWLKYEELLGM